MARIFAITCAFVAFCNVLAADGKEPPGGRKHQTIEAKNAKEETVELDLLIVTAKARGVVPVPIGGRYRVFGRRTTSPAYISVPKHPVYFDIMKKHALSPGDRVISIDGKKIEGMNVDHLMALWYEGEPGRNVTLLVQGSGESESIFRKITIKTIPIARMRKVAEESRRAENEKKTEDAPGKKPEQPGTGS